MVQNFCRHNRFIQRCPICRETVPGYTPPQTPARGTRRSAKPGDGARDSIGGTSAAGGAGSARAAGGAGSARAAGGAGSARAAGGASGHLRRIARGASRGAELRVRREARSQDDGYRCELVPGLRSSQDAQRLAEEIGFASGRLLMLTAAPPGVYAEARDCEDVEQATWMCFLCAYLSPLQGSHPFAGIRQALVCSWASGELPDLSDVPLGPRSSHDPTRGAETLSAYRRFAEHSGSQERAFTGEPQWTPQRRFERVFERLALPGLGRMGRCDLLITLGRLGLYELRADSLHLSTRPGSAPAVGGAGGASAHDTTLGAAKRVFGIGDTLHLERRAQALAHAISIPIEALDLALANWGSEERATVGFAHDTCDTHAVERVHSALGL